MPSNSARKKKKAARRAAATRETVKQQRLDSKHHGRWRIASDSDSEDSDKVGDNSDDQLDTSTVVEESPKKKLPPT